MSGRIRKASEDRGGSDGLPDRGGSDGLPDRGTVECSGGTDVPEGGQSAARNGRRQIGRQTGLQPVRRGGETCSQGFLKSEGWVNAYQVGGQLGRGQTDRRVHGRVDGHLRRS